MYEHVLVRSTIMLPPLLGVMFRQSFLPAGNCALCTTTTTVTYECRPCVPIDLETRPAVVPMVLYVASSNAFAFASPLRIASKGPGREKGIVVEAAAAARTDGFLFPQKLFQCGKSAERLRDLRGIILSPCQQHTCALVHYAAENIILTYIWPWYVHTLYAFSSRRTRGLSIIKDLDALSLSISGLISKGSCGGERGFGRAANATTKCQQC